MKIRNGFVSNSSSSSFVVSIKNTALTEEELRIHNKKMIANRFGAEEIKKYPEDYKWINDDVEAYVKDNMKVIVRKDIEWGGEDGIETMIYCLLEEFEIKKEDVRIEWGE